MMARRPQVVIPMAGSGSRFSQAGYVTPKPLLPVLGVPMYQVVLANVVPPGAQKVVLVTRAEWQLRKSLVAVECALGMEITLVEVDKTTGGPADTVELAAPLLHPDAPVVVANSDQYVDADLTKFHLSLIQDGLDGVILCMEDSDPKWSYVAIDRRGLAAVVKEKQVISPYATVGIYGFRSASLMLEGFSRMRDHDDRTNGEFYVAPSYNYLIEAGAKIGVSNLGPIGTVMHGMGVPEDYEEFTKSQAAVRATKAFVSRA